MPRDLQAAQLLAVTLIFLAFGVAEIVIGKFFAPEAGREDNRLDVAVGLMFPIVSGSVFAASRALCGFLLPAYQNAWAHWPWWGMVATLLVADDFTQYWWHRLSHTSVMWPLHRAHHSASYMSVRVVYRNNLFYYAMMPGLWLSGALLYLGFGWTFVAYSVVKLLVIMGAHSSVRWDQWLYRYRVLHPLAWVVERTISTPATH
jgi:sterol desaturase/sphingolipid hydroxylase (fatty acid hydroxylase superfamily)